MHYVSCETEMMRTLPGKMDYKKILKHAKISTNHIQVFKFVPDKHNTRCNTYFDLQKKN